MESKDQNGKTHRRKFLGSLATGAVAMSIGTLATPLQSMAKKTAPATAIDDPDEWFKKIKGKHRLVFDVTQPNGLMPFAWPRVYLMTNAATGTPEKDSNAVVVLRHYGIPYAMEDQLWLKYKLGEVFNINDEGRKAPAVHNAFWKPKPGDFKVPGIGNVAIGINELQESGVMFCVCHVAMTVYSNVIAQRMNLKAEDVLKDFTAGLLPGIQIVPSGVWAVGRAQEHGCGYCFAG